MTSEDPTAQSNEPWGHTRHGTTNGYKRHRALGEAVCEACREAKASYDARWRSIPERTAKNRAVAAARNAALSRLAKMHPYHYDRLFAEEKSRRGLE